MDSIDFISIISVAFLGSIGHCSGMCGGLVVAYSSIKLDKASRFKQIVSHLTYNLGRTFSYMILGAIFGFLGSVISLSMQTKGVLFLIIAIFMVLMGLSLIGKIKFLNSIELNSNGFLQKTLSKVLKSDSNSSFFTLGVLNGFLPCGFVYFFLASAVATSSPLWGAVVMMIFGLSTIPIMFGVGFFVGFLKSTKFRNIMMKLASIVIIIYGLFMGFKAVMLMNGEMPMNHNHSHMGGENHQMHNMDSMQMSHSEMNHSQMKNMNHSNMNHSKMNHSDMNHSN